MFTVEWLPSAALEFANIWLSANDQQQAVLVAALAVFKRNLTTDPFGCGESRDPGVRIVFEPPLGITYRIDRDGYTVSILHVWRFQAPV